MANQSEKKNQKNYNENIHIYFYVLIGFTTLKALGTLISIFLGTVSFWDFFLFFGIK